MKIKTLKDKVQSAWNRIMEVDLKLDKAIERDNWEVFDRLVDERDEAHYQLKQAERELREALYPEPSAEALRKAGEWLSARKDN